MSVFSVALIAALLACIAAEYCGDVDDCFMENCPIGYTVNCLEHVCTCETPTTPSTGGGGSSSGECSVPSDCMDRHGICDNNDKHWYCNGGRCCCGEPCPGYGERFVCTSADDCYQTFYRCENNDKHWYCSADHHCHCGSPNGELPGE